MKAKILLLTLSIFCISHICSGQQNKNAVFSLCDYKPRYISKTCLPKIFNSGCAFVNYKDSLGNALEITGYIFTHMDSAFADPYYEKVVGNGFSPEIKKRLLNAGSKEMIFFTNVECLTSDKKRIILSGADYYITE